jgi:exodeoxyribonuclease VII small subunit
MTNPEPPDVKPADLTYEQAREELAEVVRQLENGGIPLESSLALWERGEELARICEAWLDGARARVEAALEESAKEQDA